jgi:UDP-N-acetylglucosamine 1-carboxyvinyltransferase
LDGRVAISGAKNAALPAMTAALLTDQRVILRNIPRVRDISTLRSLLEDLGVDSSVTHEAHGNRIEIETRQLLNPVAPYELVKQMRASVLVLGPLVARFGQARVSLPGGCAIGVRPINLHIKGLEKLGATITFDHGYVNAQANGLRGTDFRFDTISVTGTENLMMAAALAEGDTVLENAAREPEVQDLADLLNKMGAHIEGAGTDKIRIRGASRLHGAEHTVVPDRIEAATFLTAAAITGGELVVERCNPGHLAAIVAKLREVGVRVLPADQPGADGNQALSVKAEGKLQAADMTTEEYPGFPTDMQAQYMARLPKPSSKTASCTLWNWRAWAQTSRSTAAAPWCAARLT